MARRPTQRAIAESRATLDRVVDRQTLRPIQRVWDQEVGRLHRHLSRATRGRGRPMPADVRALRASTRGVIADAATRIGAQLQASTGQTLVEGLRSLARFLGLMEGGRAGILDNEGMIQTLAGARRVPLEALRAQNAGALAVSLDGAVGRSLGMIVVEGEAPVYTVVVQQIADTVDSQWWQVERIARTEAVDTYNVAQSDGIARVDEESRDLYKRWTELVDDRTGRKLDDKVADDSLVLHGQLARPGGMFTMPPDPRAPPKMVGKKWAHPPNRPNDRATLIPWKRAWDIPGWIWQRGMRVPIE